MYISFFLTKHFGHLELLGIQHWGKVIIFPLFIECFGRFKFRSCTHITDEK
jgi:hypothetical protein